MKKILLLIVIFISSLAFTHSTFAANFSSLTFKSNLDRFKIKKAGKHYTLNGKSINAELLNDTLSLFSNELIDSCPNLKGVKNDLTITASTHNQTQKMIIYLDKKLISDGKSCGSIEGDGFTTLPFHRSWFKEDSTVKISLKKHITLKENESSLATFSQEDKKWISNDPSFIPNWEFFDEFKSQISHFTISGRRHQNIAKDLKPIILTTNNKTYKFYKTGPQQWAAQLPKVKWLVLSRNFYIFQDMTVKKWQDRKSQVIQAISNNNLELDKRIDSFNSLKNYWSRSLKYSLHSLILDFDEKPEIKLQALKRLRRHPSDDTISIAVDALSKTEDRLIQMRIIQILKSRNPRGPSIDPDIESDSDEQTLSFWERWKKKGYKKTK